MKGFMRIAILMLLVGGLPGCGGGTVGSDRSGSTGGETRGITVEVSGQVTDEQTGQPVVDLPVFSSAQNDIDGDEDINSEIVFTGIDGTFNLPDATTDSLLDLKVNFDDASIVLESLPEDSARIRMRVNFRRDMEQSTATPTEIEVERKSSSDKKTDKDQEKAKTDAPDQQKLDSALESTTTGSTQQSQAPGGGSGDSASAPGSTSGSSSSETNEAVDTLIDEADLY